MRTALLLFAFILTFATSVAQTPSYQFKTSITPIPALTITNLSMDTDGTLYVLQPSSVLLLNGGKVIHQFPINQDEYTDSYVSGPRDIAVDQDKNVYLLNFSKKRIEKHDATGQFVHTFEVKDAFTEYEKRFLPFQLKFGSDNNLYVYGHNRTIQVYNTDGQFLRSVLIPALEDLNYLSLGLMFTLDAQDNFYVLEKVRDKTKMPDFTLLNVYDKNGKHIRAISSQAIRNKIDFADIAVDSNGDIYISSDFASRIQVFSPAGELKKEITTEYYLSSYNISRRLKIEFDNQNNMYVGGSNYYGSTIHAYDQSENLLYQLGDLKRPREVVFDHENNILILDAISRQVVKMGLNGQVISTFGGSGSSGSPLVNPQTLAADREGNTYVIDVSGNYSTIKKYNPAGELIKNFSNIESYNMISSGFYVSSGLAVDYAGNIYVTSHNTHALTKYSPDGKIIYKKKSPGKEKGQLWKPKDVSVDGSGFVYVTDINGHRIQKFSPTGDFIQEYGTFSLDEYDSSTRSSIAADAFGNFIISSNFTSKPTYYDVKGNKLFKLPDGTESLAFSPDGQYIITADPKKDKVTIYETENRFDYNYITGKVYVDADLNCSFDTNENGLANILVKAEPGPYYSITDKQGNYKLLVEKGSFAVSPVLEKMNDSGKLIEQSCPDTDASFLVQFDDIGNVAPDKNIGAKVTLSPHLSVSVSSTRRRRCFESTTIVHYENSGFATAPDANVYLKLPAEVELLSADKAYTRLPDGTYEFAVGDMEAGQKGTITITDMVSCGDERVRGRTVCTRAWIMPYNNPPAKPTPTVSITGRCDAETGRIRFVIRNSGTADMEQHELFRKYVDGQLASKEQFKLAAGDSMVLWVPSMGYTWRLEADQPEGNGDNTMASVTVEACTDANAGTTFSSGLVNLMPTDDEEVEVSEECVMITDSYDPNDKLVTPVGRTSEHYTSTTAELKYKIRFQNTGTDVAYRVVVVDTLSEHLDLSTLQIGASSHTHSLEVSGKGRPVLTWTFDNIMLPDSNANEPGSHGYIQFSIKPKPDLPEMTAVENFADIFFDYNSPVRTNIILNRIYDMPPVVDEAVRVNLEDVLANPSISAFEPTAGKFGAEVTITGKRFAATASDNKVYLNGKAATVVNATDSELRVLVPEGATTGALKVITPDAGVTTMETFEVYQPPVLSSFSPAEGIAGSTVALQGQHLSINQLPQVYLGDQLCQVSSAASGGLQITVPAGATTGKFIVYTEGGKAVNEQAFRVWQQPEISALSKHTDKAGTELRIFGNNFAEEASRNKVYLGQTEAIVLQATEKMLLITIPAAPGGQVKVMTPGGEALSEVEFELIPAPVLVQMKPESGTVGSVVELQGQQFLTLGRQDTVSFNGTKARILSASPELLKVQVPRGVSTGKVEIRGAGGAALSINDFVVQELALPESIVISPNPNSGSFIIDLQRADFDVQLLEVFNNLGQLVLKQAIAAPRPEALQVQLPNAQAGIYQLRLHTGRGIYHYKLYVR